MIGSSVLWGADGVLVAVGEVIAQAMELAESPDPKAARLRGALRALEKQMQASEQVAALQLALECILQLTEDPHAPADLRLQQVQGLARDVLYPERTLEVSNEG